jgi:hypothetical protein
MSGADRHYEFTWVGEYAIDSMIVQVQQPVSAINMRIEPDLGSFQAGSDGLMYYGLEIGAISSSDSISVKVDYQKDNDVLSIENFDVSAPIQSETSTQVDASLTNWLPWFLGGLGLLLVAGSLWWYLRSGSDIEPASKTTRRGRRSSSIKPGQSDSGAAIYCHQCGKRAAKNDRFCRGCGIKLRT